MPGAARPLSPLSAGRNVVGARRRADECPRGRDYDVCPSGARPRHRAAIDQCGPRAGAVPGWRSGDGGVCVAHQIDLFTKKRRYARLARPAEMRRPVARGAVTHSLSATWALERSRSAAAIVKRRPGRTRARGTGRRVQFHVALQTGVFPGSKAGGNGCEALRWQRHARRSPCPQASAAHLARAASSGPPLVQASLHALADRLLIARGGQGRQMCARRSACPVRQNRAA